jgi:hypothetical protein
MSNQQLSTEPGQLPLEIEHIDGDWRNLRMENLTVLCPNCHALTRSFRGQNRGKGRPGRSGARVSARPAYTPIHYPVHRTPAEK